MKDSKTRLYQFELDLRNADCGMFYAFQVADGSFFLIDSAHPDAPNDCARIHDFLRALTPKDRKIHIAGWFLSHAHDDHIGKFMEFVNANYEDSVIDKVYYNFPKHDHSSAELWSDNVKEYLLLFEELQEKRPDIGWSVIHTGDTIEIGNLHIEVLLTCEDMVSQRFSNFNDTSSVLMVTCENTKIFFPGDAGTEESNMLVQKYGKSLKADIIQYAHHGYKGLLSDCYDLVDAPVILISTQYENFLRSKAKDINERTMKKAEEIYFSCDGTVELELPYKPHTAKVSERIFHIDKNSMELGAKLELGRIIDKIAFGDEAQTAKLKKIFAQCYMNTIETTVNYNSKDGAFVITGDIPAMWQRDSSMQVVQYLPLLKRDPSIKLMVSDLLEKQFTYMAHDPYANAFMENERCVSKHAGDRTNAGKLVWERKFEIDSICFPIWLLTKYFYGTSEPGILDENILNGIRAGVEVLETELDHNNSPYFFERPHRKPTDTLVRNGLGPEIRVNGLIWSGFRPSDDACTYSYNIPENIFASSVLRGFIQMVNDINEGKAPDEYGFTGELPKPTVMQGFLELAKRAERVADSVDRAVKETVVHNEEFGDILPFETDGLGNYICMDDANMPGLLGLPWLGAMDQKDPLYLNTRRFVLSKQNPYYFEGKEARGIGSAHTPSGYVWPIGLTVQALTSDSRAEQEQILKTLIETTAGTDFMHEGFNVNDCTDFSRPWFAWANSMFAELVMKMFKL